MNDDDECSDDEEIKWQRAVIEHAREKLLKAQAEVRARKEEIAQAKWRLWRMGVSPPPPEDVE